MVENIYRILDRRFNRAVFRFGPDPELWLSEEECCELESQPGQPSRHQGFMGARIQVHPADVVAAYDRDLERSMRQEAAEAVDELLRIVRRSLTSRAGVGS